MSNSTKTVVKFNDTFYLKNKSDRYLVAVDRGRYDFPQLDRTGRVKLQLTGSTGEIKHGDKLKIRSLEAGLGDRDILGAFTDSHNCYYWKDGYDDEKQSWYITKANGKGGAIHYGDEIYLTNVCYNTQTLVSDTKYPGYLTTAEGKKEVWSLESTKVPKSVEKQIVRESSKSDPTSVFGSSVASGDPTPNGVILWTRINPEAYQDKMDLEYQVSLKRNFDDSNIILHGTIPASNIGKTADYTVKLDLSTIDPEKTNFIKYQKLKSNQTYFYKFIYGEVDSQIGRCKTLPAARDELQRLRLAVLTCNDYSTGYFNALYHLAEEDIDFVIHLGDFVYEYPQYPPGYGEIVRTDLQLTDNRFPTSDPKNADRTTSLQDFRHVYRTYRQDPALQRAMEQHTWIITLDDHEIADNCYWDYQNNTMDISVDEPLHPIYEHLNKNSAKAKKAMRQLYLDATQAWREYIPARIEKVNNSNDPRYKLYRHFRFGSLVDFFLTDSRSFRDKPNLELNEQILEKAREKQEANPKANISQIMSDVREEMGLKEWQASMLGKEQKEWLIDGITKGIVIDDTYSKATWKVWGNQTLLATSWANELIGEIDDWHGFKAERYEILQAVKDSETAENKTDRTSHFVVFTGDMHTSLIAYLKTDFSDVSRSIPASLPDISNILTSPLDSITAGVMGVANKFNLNYSKLAGVEFMTPALTSPGLSELLDEKSNLIPGKSTLSSIWESLPSIPGLSDSSEAESRGSVMHKPTSANLIKRLSPHIEHFDSSINGYAIAEFTSDKLQWNVYAIDKKIYDKADDGRNISTKRAKKELVQSATYSPNGISLDD